MVTIKTFITTILVCSSFIIHAESNDVVYNAVDDQDQLTNLSNNLIAKDVRRSDVTFNSPYVKLTKEKGLVVYNLIYNEADLKKINDIKTNSTTQKAQEAQEAQDNDFLNGEFLVRQIATLDDCNLSGYPLSACNGEANLLFRVSTFRSKPFNSMSSEIDNKYVRISLDNGGIGAGSGIHLSKNLLNSLQNVNKSRRGVWSHLSNAYIDSVNIGIRAEQLTASEMPALQSYFPENQNKDYAVHHTVGKSFKVSLNLKSPKDFGASAEFSVNDSVTMSFSTQDLSVASNPYYNGFNVSFQQDGFEEGCDLLRYTSSVLRGCGYKQSVFSSRTNPLDLSKLSPILYAGFSPAIDSMFSVDGSTVGTSKFYIDTSIFYKALLSESRHIMIYYEYMLMDELSYQKSLPPIEFEINWESPAFLGTTTVNLQSSSKDLCLSVEDDAATLKYKTCKIDDLNQAFLYDEYGRYVSAKHQDYCLARDSLPNLSLCHLSLDQIWNWQDKESFSSVLFNTDNEGNQYIIEGEVVPEVQIWEGEHNLGKYLSRNMSFIHNDR